MASKKYWGLERGPLLARCLSQAGGKSRRQAVVKVLPGVKKGALLGVTGDEQRLNVTIVPAGNGEIEKEAALKSPLEVRIRDAMGSLVGVLEKYEVDFATIDLDGSVKLVDAMALGLELALYRYLRVLKGEEPKFKLEIKCKGRSLPLKALQPGMNLGWATNIARHLTNLPPNVLNPVTYADFAVSFMKNMKGVKVEVWDEKRLAAENMNLHLGAGRGGAAAPRLVRIRYSGAAKKPHIALVGKGVTFDSGGLDIKPANGMRLMKKDMGGSAAVFATLYWAAHTKAKCNLDGYLALAENAIDSGSFRPSDVLVARNGLSVEIHNTDAEGRLVLADALDVAVSQKPRCVIDVATLTGAIKAGLGSQIAGLFGNDRRLTSALQKAGQQSGDLNWPMPLFQRYMSQLKSNFADLVNCSDGFGGAVTAALFLERFTGDVPWAHLDIYAWKDAPEGAWLESGGSGQGVLCLSQWLRDHGR